MRRYVTIHEYYTATIITERHYRLPADIGGEPGDIEWEEYEVANEDEVHEIRDGPWRIEVIKDVTGTPAEDRQRADD
jgi:hypothetical protein